ncbi:uncharacterized protein LOC124903185 [Homo sapiens]|uniref:uncharacterized protein LOC124903185 n=1 Tax=Homo sapiens TaxID=9606 RepID=UPI001FB18D8D|nr:uncharacterized protein LOC124903185 [Homo sapiens]XP_047302154.1 uncharacterized protein LOC124903185 [Homo sapiens]
MEREKSKPWRSKQLRFDKNNKSGSFSSFSKPFCQNKLVLLGRRNCLRPYAPICSSLQKCLGLFHTEPVGGGGDHCRWTGQIARAPILERVLSHTQKEGMLHRGQEESRQTGLAGLPRSVCLF